MCMCACVCGKTFKITNKCATDVDDVVRVQ